MIIAPILFAVATAAAAFLWVFRRLAGPRRDPALEGDWLAHFSPDKYRPMARLLDDADFTFLAAHPAYSPRMARRLRAERRRVFRGYLRSLERDFGRISGAIQLLMLHSEIDRPDLATMLVRQRVRFAYFILTLQVRLALDAVGLRGVNVRPLLGALDALRGELQQLVPVAVPSAA